MIEYIFGATLVGAGLAVAKYLYDERYSRKFNKEVEKNKILFDSFTPEIIERLADAIYTEPEKKDLSSKL